MPPDKLTPNQVVAWNLKEARRMRDWTQEQAAEALEPYLGERWSKATFSAAERSIDGDRIRQFTADDIYAFARGFDVPLSFFFCPPTWAEDAGGIGHANSSEATSPWDYLDLVFDVREDAPTSLLRRTIPMTPQTTRALPRWGEHFAAMVADRQRAVDALLEAARAPQEEER